MYPGLSRSCPRRKTQKAESFIINFALNFLAAKEAACVADSMTDSVYGPDSGEVSIPKQRAFFVASPGY